MEDGREVCLEGALALELAQDGIVVVDQLRLRPRGEVFGLISLAAVPSAERGDHPLDQIEILEEQLLLL